MCARSGLYNVQPEEKGEEEEEEEEENEEERRTETHTSVVYRLYDSL